MATVAEEKYVDMQTRYIRALKDMIYSKGPFGLEKIQMKHGTSSLGKILRELEWTKVARGGEPEWNNHGFGTMWIGPIPEDEAHLSSMATILRKKVREAGRAYRNKTTTSDADLSHRVRKLIERLANGEQGYDVAMMVDANDLPAHLSDTLHDIHWVKARTGSSLQMWIGPQIKTNSQMNTAEAFLMQYVKTPEREVEQVPEAPVPEPTSPEAQQAITRISILWGLFKIERTIPVIP